MERRIRTKILIEDQEHLIQELADSAQRLFTIEVREAAHLGLLMNPARETAKKSLFYLGETLITRARVEINGVMGLGLISGEEYQKAFDLAVIDAAYPQLSLTEKILWDERLLTCQQKNLQRLLKKQAHIQQTKVSFETMEVAE
ncbi:phosphonate C-P lyase system protein PhnG [Enterococcus sp. LJL90]